MLEKSETERKRAEEERIKAEERERRTLDNILEGCMIIGFNWTYLYVNDIAAVHGHQKRDNLIGRTMLEMYPGVEKSAIFAAYQCCMEERIHQRLESEYTFPDGTTNWYELSVEPVPEGIFVLSLDITERKLAEQSLSRMASILENTPDFVATADINGNALYMNRGAWKMLGIEEKADISQLSIPDAHPEWASALVKNVGFPTAIRDGFWSGETALIKCDGKEIPVLQMILAHKANDGSVEFYSTIMRDITERKLVEEALRKSEVLLNETQQLTKLGGWEYDVNTSKMTWTEETYRIYGVTPADYDPNDVSKDIEFYAPIDRLTIESAFRRAVEEGESYDLELKFRNAQGKDIWVRTIGKAERKNGRLTRVFGNIMDITERKQIEEALKESEERYRTIIEFSNDMIWTLDTEGRFLFFNNLNSLDFPPYNLKSTAVVSFSKSLNPIISSVFSEIPVKFRCHILT